MEHSALTTIFVLVVLEVILSADNALILGIMVQALPAKLRAKALFYGIAGAYMLRGLALFFAASVIKLWWVQLAGALYLLYVAGKHFAGSVSGAQLHPRPTLQAPTKGQFWRVVVQIELMDLAFAVDSVLVAVALSTNLWVIYTGVFLGILALRFLATLVVRLLDQYVRFKHLAYAVVGLAGVKLAVSGWDKFAGQVLHRPDLVLNINEEAFGFLIVGFLLVGSLWALRLKSPVPLPSENEPGSLSS